jgi:hypothetical protein
MGVKYMQIIHNIMTFSRADVGLIRDNSNDQQITIYMSGLAFITAQLDLSLLTYY